jgi:hypothetical protein
MFNVLVSGNGEDWELGGVMAMTSARFTEYSGEEAKGIKSDDCQSLQRLNGTMAILMYEVGRENADVVRIGRLQNVKRRGQEVSFRFIERGRVARADVAEFAKRIDLADFENSRHHWAIKDGSIPRDLLDRASTTPERYDVALSFAGEDRAYVQNVAEALIERGVHVFYDENDEVELEMWGKDLTEHLHSVFRDRARFCVMFISKSYAEKVWTRLERRSALERALREKQEYVLPARFDDTEIPGLRSSIAYVDLKAKTAEDFAKLIARKVADTGA